MIHTVAAVKTLAPVTSTPLGLIYYLPTFISPGIIACVQVGNGNPQGLVINVPPGFEHLNSTSLQIYLGISTETIKLATR